MITVILRGGLGNQMFQYATAKSLSMRLNTDLQIDLTFIKQHKHKLWCRPYELEIFELPACYKKTRTEDELITRLLPIFHKHKIGKQALLQLNYHIEDPINDNSFWKLKDGIKLFGTFANEKYFIDYRNDILKEFTFKGHLNEINNQIANNIGNSNSVSVHIRRGDYLDPKNKQWFAQCSIDWYQNALQYIKDRVENPVYLFFSDDMVWVKENFASIPNAYFIDFNNGADSYNDMILMSLCKHNIIANSSFSWWGAWLNINPDKIVIAPKQYYIEEQRNKSVIHNIMPDSWVLL
jgi:hypothetical protein